jgi:hypothetical protein
MTSPLVLPPHPPVPRGAKSPTAAPGAPTARARLAYDRKHLPLLDRLFAFSTRTRAELEAAFAAARKAASPEAARRELEALRLRNEKAVLGELAAIGGYDPERGTPQARDDIDFLMHALASDLPMAMIQALGSDTPELRDVRKELDRLQASYIAWARRVRAGRPAPR